MGITVKFFASLREAIGVDEITIESADATTAGKVLVQLYETNPSWKSILQLRQPMIAVNQEMASIDTLVKSGDEVAFFPPMTGG